MGELEDLRKKLSELEKSCKKYEELSIIDDLTSLYNRRGFMTIAGHQFALSKRRHQELLLFFIDLDNLKTINDSYGHKEGDAALIETARIIKKTFRVSDIEGRWGGDEFAVLAIDSSIVEFDSIRQRMVKFLDLHNKKSDKPYRLSFSVGAASYRDGKYYSIEELLEDADADLYRKKTEKKGTQRSDANGPTSQASI